MYKMLVLDLDGTLLNSESVVSPENAAAIVRAHQKGVTVVLATGRPPVGTREVRACLGKAGDEYLITYNGALIENIQTNRTIAMHTLRVADYLDVAAFARSLGIFCYGFTKSVCLTPARHEIPEMEGRVNGIEVLLTDFSRIDPATPLVKIMLTGSPDELDRCQASVPSDLGSRFGIFRSQSLLLEFMNPLASKGQAVSELAGLLGIRRDEVICIGDSGNDIDMIQYAGLGVAMGNATEEIRTAADFVTLHHDQHGVAYVIDRFIRPVSE